jgi:hypothetical protein
MILKKMVKFLTVVAVTTSTVNAQSVIKIVENTEAIFYIKPETIRKNANTVDFLQITNFKQPQQNKKGELYKSIEQKLTMDCINNNQTVTFMKIYSSSMATGNLIASGPTKQKKPIPSGSSLDVIKQYVCR